MKLREAMNAAIREKLNPLFKVHEVLAVPRLPRTASNKIMRRVLRDEYLNRRDHGRD
jgi:acetyl-CoA synthetase